VKAKEIFFAICGLALISAVAWLWLSPSSGLQTAPPLALTSLDGKPVNLADYRGKPVLVTFWATTCPGCVAEMPHLVELYQMFAPQGFKILAIAMPYDDPNHVAEMVRQRQLPYTVAHDLQGSAAAAFGNVSLTPTSFLISPDGRIVQHTLGELDMGQLEQRIQAMLKTKVG